MFGESNKKPDFLKKFPLGKVPAFEGSDGLLLTESNAIAYYVANDELRGGADAAARAQVCCISNFDNIQGVPGKMIICIKKHIVSFSVGHTFSKAGLEKPGFSRILFAD